MNKKVKSCPSTFDRYSRDVRVYNCIQEETRVYSAHVISALVFQVEREPIVIVLMASDSPKRGISDDSLPLVKKRQKSHHQYFVDGAFIEQ